MTRFLLNLRKAADRPGLAHKCVSSNVHGVLSSMIGNIGEALDHSHAVAEEIEDIKWSYSIHSQSSLSTSPSSFGVKLLPINSV